MNVKHIAVTPPRLLAILVVGLLAVGMMATVAATAHGAGRATLKTSRSSLGRILVDSQGRTLYLFEKDKRNRSMCSGACATYWPPLKSARRMSVGAGVKRSLLGVARRSDGSMQVTYAGHPLYRFALDTGAGQTKGEGLNDFGGGWDVISPAGKKIEKD